MSEKSPKAKIDALKKKIQEQLDAQFGQTPVEGPIEVNLSGKTFEEMKASIQENLGKKFDPSNIVAHTTSEPDPTDDIMDEIKKAQEALLKHGHATFKSDQITIGDFTLKSDGTAATGDVTSHYTVTPPDSSFKPMGWSKDASPEDILNDLKSFKEKYAPKTEYKSAHAHVHASDEALAKLKAKLYGNSDSVTFGVQSGSFMQLDQHGNPMGEPVPLSASNVYVGPKKPTAESMLVELAGASGVAKYVHASINADWDPEDHPRDPNTGEFVKGPVGYIFGKAKKAKFAGPSASKGNIEVDLKPGDVAFHTPAKNVVVSHADGSYTLHSAAGVTKEIPEGSHNNLADWAQKGQLKKIAENPGTTVKASTKSAAAKMIAEPATFNKAGQVKGAKAPAAKGVKGGDTVHVVGKGAPGKSGKEFLAEVKAQAEKKYAKAAQKDPVLPDQINMVKGGSITPAPEFKPGKTKYTAKQITQFQAENDGKMLDADKSGQTITSGSWVDINGTPYQVFASPYNPGDGFTAYKWVKTKQQAANESKEDPFQLGDATVIPDPTGKPYLGVGVEAAKPKAKEVSLGTGSLMSQADTVVEVPNASVAHAKHLTDSLGEPLDTSGDVIGADADFEDPLTDAGTTPLNSGDWVEIGGKPYQVHSSPNKGNIALKKWVATKKQAATTSYDFPAGVLVANKAVLIADPTGEAYIPLPNTYIDNYVSSTLMSVKDEASDFQKAADAFEAKAKEVTEPTPEPVSEILETAPEPAPKPTQIGSITIMGSTYQKMSDGSWKDGFFNPVSFVPDDIEMQWEDLEVLKAKINSMQTGDTLYATSLAQGTKSSYTAQSDGLVHASHSGQTSSLEKLMQVVASQWDKFNFTIDLKADKAAPEADEAPVTPEPADLKTNALNHVANSKPGDSLEWGYENFTPDIYTKQPDGVWELVDTGQAKDYGSEYEPSLVTQEELVTQLKTSGGHAKYLNYLKAAGSIEEDDTETTVAAPAPENVFVDAASGTTISLNPGDKVFKNTDTEGMYAVEKADGGTTVYNGSGLVFPTFMDMATYTDWEEADTWPGKVEGKKTIQPDPWAVAASGSPDQVMQDVSALTANFKVGKAKAGDTLTLSSGAGEDEIYTFNGGGVWTMSTPNSPDLDEVWTSKELAGVVEDLVNDVTVSYASSTLLTDPDHPFSSADGQTAAQSPQTTVLKDDFAVGQALPGAPVGSTLSVHYADGVTETMMKQDNGNWNPPEDVNVLNGYDNFYLAGIIDNDTYLTLTTNPDPVTLTATPEPEPEPAPPAPLGTSLAGLLTANGNATPALLDTAVQIGTSNINKVPTGTKIFSNDPDFSTFTKDESGLWVDGDNISYMPSQVLEGVTGGQLGPNYDFSDVNFVIAEPATVQVNDSLIDTAMPGDKVQIMVGGVMMTYTKTEDGWMNKSGLMAPGAQTIKALAKINSGTFVYAGNDHTAPSKAESSDSGNPNLPDGVTEGIGATKPGPEKTQQTSTSKAKAAQAGEVTLPDGTLYKLKPGEAFGFIENFTGGGSSKPNVSVLVTAAGENKVWNAEGVLQSLSAWWGPDKAIIKMTPTTLKNSIKKFGGELHGINTYKKAKTDPSAYGTFDTATNTHIESVLDSSLPTSNVWAWQSHNNPFSSTRVALINMIHGGVASPSQPHAKAGEDGYKGIVPVGYIGIDTSKPFHPDPDTGDLLSWSDLDEQTRVSIVAKIAPVAAGFHNLLNAAYTPEEIDSWTDNNISADDIKKFKSRLTANKNALIGLTRLGEFAEALADPDSTKTGGWTIDSLEAELGVVQKWAKGPKNGLKDFDTAKVPVEEFVSAVTAAFQKRKFAESLTGLDFDPLHGTTEEYDAYAKSKGFEHLSLLSPTDQKTWVLADLGDPSIGQYTKNALSSKLAQAKQKAALATLSASLKASQVKDGINPHANVPSAPEEGTSPYGVTSMKQGLKKSYAWKFKGIQSGFTWLSEDDWLMEVAGSESIHINDAMVKSAVEAIHKSLANGEDTYTDFKESKFPAYAGVSVADSIKAKFAEHGLDAEDLLDAEGSVVTSWSDYANENKDALVAASVAEGSPLDMEFMETLPVAGLTYLAVKGSGDKVWDYLFQKQWNGGVGPLDHPGDPDSSPEAVAALTALANKVASLPGGEIYLEDNANGAQKAKIATSLGVPPVLANQWVSNFPGYMLAQYKSPDLEQVTGEGLAPGESHASKPAGVTDEVWNVVLNLTPDTDVSDLVGLTVAGYTEGELESLLTQHSSAPYAGVPKPFKQLALWGATGGATPTIPEREQFLKAVNARVQAGDFLAANTSVWTHPETGSKFPVSAGAVVLKVDGGYNATGYLVTNPPGANGKPTAGFFFSEDSPNSPSKKSGATFSGYLNLPSAKVLFTVPDPVTYEKAKAAKGPGLGSELTDSVWSLTEKIEAGTYEISSYGTNAVLTAAMKNSDYLKANYPALYAQKTSLPEPVKNAIVSVLQASTLGGSWLSAKDLAKNTKHPVLDLLEYKAGQGHYASMGSAGLFDAGQPWNAYLSKGLTSPAEVGHWSTTATDAYVAHFGLKDVSQISPHLTAILHPEAPVAETGVSWKNLPDFNSLSLTNTGKNPGGMHTKHVWVDTNGDEWMSKAFNSDPNAKARVDAETNANKIGALFGFGNPVAETVALTNTGKISGAGTGQGAGSYTYFQHMKPATGSFSGKSPNDLSTKQLQQAMSHHVLDWIVSNHDTHSENLLLGKDGNVFGIDLGQAFKFFPQDKLAVGYLPPGNGAPVWYDQFYKGIQNGSIDKATADDVVKHVLRTAQRVAKTNDAEYKAMLTDALKYRENFPAQYPTAEKFIDALMERKHSTLDDFVDLYKGIYASSPYEWDIDPENLTPPKIGDAHVSVTSDLTKSVMKSKATGQALMVDSLDLEDSYLMLQPQKAKNGSHLLLGEAKVRKDGDKKLVAWLKSQTVVDNTSTYGYDTDDDYGNSVTYSGPNSSEPVWSALPANNELFSAMVNYSKTVSSHNKSGDHAYNANTLSIAASAKVGIDSMLKSMEYWEKQNPNIPYAGKPTGYFIDYTVHMYTMEQHTAFKTMLETYQGYYDTVKSKEGSDQKVTPHFTQVTYSPSAEVKAAYFAAKGLPSIASAAEPGTSITWKDGSTTYIATKDKKGLSAWTLSTQVGKAEPTTQQISDSVISMVLQSEPSAQTTDESAIKPIEEVEESATVQVGTKVLKVSLKNAAYPKSTFDHGTGEQNRLGGESTGGYQNSGQMFEVDFGNVKITYRPWDPSYGVYSAQQGLLKFEKSDWDGNSADAPASLNEILDVLRQMGLDLDAADETSLETFYWAHMAGVLKERKDGKSAKWGKVNKHLETALNDSLSPTERLEVYREAWAKAITAERVEQVKASGWWKPRLSHTSLHALDSDDIENGEVSAEAEKSGRPYWFRPDLTMEELYTQVGDEGPSANLTYGGSWSDASLIATSGGSLSSEERARYYGHQAKAGASSGSDADKGSSGFVFMRSTSTNNHAGGQVYFHPRVYLRTTNYGFNSDNYGAVVYRKTQSTWDPANSFSHTVEYMTKGAVSVLSDYAILTFQTEQERQDAIAAYKAKGITTINGIPIEEFFHKGQVSQSTYDSIIKRLWKKAIEEEKQMEGAFA